MNRFNLSGKYEYCPNGNYWQEVSGIFDKDIAILVKPNKITNPNTTQRHLRKIHTYFWVFQKKVNRKQTEELLELTFDP